MNDQQPDPFDELMRRALANEAANRFFDVDRLRRVINRRWRSRPSQGAAEQRAADKSTHHAGGDLTILCSGRRRYQKRTSGQRDNHDG